MTEEPITVRRVPGWSTETHLRFFRDRLADLVAVCKGPIRILVLGVYQGADICIIQCIANKLHPNFQFEIVGVDKFDDQPCDDWPEEKHGMTWEQAFGCPAPSFEAACRHIEPSPPNVVVEILKLKDTDFFEIQNVEPFDMAYLDTSHDYATVQRQLRQIKPWLRSDSSIVSGDDFTDKDGWGVARAVSEGLKYYKVCNGRIWHGKKKELI